MSTLALPTIAPRAQPLLSGTVGVSTADRSLNQPGLAAFASFMDQTGQAADHAVPDATQVATAQVAAPDTATALPPQTLPLPAPPAVAIALPIGGVPATPGVVAPSKGQIATAPDAIEGKAATAEKEVPTDKPALTVVDIPIPRRYRYRQRANHRPRHR